VFSTLPHGQFGLMTGTSQATATMTGKLVERMGYIRSDKYANILYTHRLHDK
jgi:hypothetical protein